MLCLVAPPKTGQSGKVTAAAADSDLDSNSSGSEDQPLREPPVGTKRKAEVLKESGKIGVTIKTSPSSIPPSSSSSSSTTTLSASLINPTKNDLAQAPTAQAPPPVVVVHSQQEAAPQSQKVQPQAPPPGKVQLLDSAAAKHSKVMQISVPVANRAQTNKNANEPAAPLSPETPASRPESNTPPELRIEGGGGENKNNVGAVAPDQNQDDNDNNNCGDQMNKMPLSPRTAHPRLWLPKNRNADQVFITDVTVNLETVTIRECKTERGFFRERDLATSS